MILAVLSIEGANGVEGWEAHTMAEGKDALRTCVPTDPATEVDIAHPGPRGQVRTELPSLVHHLGKVQGAPLGRRSLQVRAIVFSITVIPTYSFETIN